MKKEERLTPNQTRTTKFPITGEQEPSVEINNWELEICGLVKQPLKLSFTEFLQLPAAEKVWDTICVTGWTHFDHRWTGVMLDTLMTMAEPLSEARFVRFVSYSGRKK